MEIIVSADNKYVKLVNGLSLAKNRKRENSFVIEGEKLIAEAAKNGYVFRTVLVAESKAEAYSELINSLKHNATSSDNGNYEIKTVADNIFNKLCDTVSPQGILAVARIKDYSFTLPESDFLILDRVRDPANLGACLRTAAAAGFNDVYTLDCCDAYNPKAVRSSMSGLFYTKVMEIDNACVSKLKAEKDIVLAAAVMGGQDIFGANFDKSVKYGVIIGNEGSGIDTGLEALCGLKLAIPMKNIESLNAAVSAGIIMYQLAVQKRR